MALCQGSSKPLNEPKPGHAGTRTALPPSLPADTSSASIASVTKYVRNALEEVEEVVNPLGKKTLKEYDKAGNLIKLTDPAKRTITYKYDPLEEVSYSSGKPSTIKYEYNKDGDRTKMTDGTGTTKYGYDQLDRMTESENGHKEVAKYEYNLGNQQTKITYPSTKAVERIYDRDGRLEKITDWNKKETKFAYNEDSDLKKITFPSETKDEDTYAYNDADQMSEVKMAKSTETLASLVYTRDNDGQVKKTTAKALPGAEVTENTYDENNRLTKYAAPNTNMTRATTPPRRGRARIPTINATSSKNAPASNTPTTNSGSAPKRRPKKDRRRRTATTRPATLPQQNAPKKAKPPKSKTPTPITVKTCAHPRRSPARPPTWCGTWPKNSRCSSATGRTATSMGLAVCRSSRSQVVVQRLTCTTTSKGQRGC
jgi:YD repeat-containing protein